MRIGELEGKVHIPLPDFSKVKVNLTERDSGVKDLAETLADGYAWGDNTPALIFTDIMNSSLGCLFNIEKHKFLGIVNFAPGFMLEDYIPRVIKFLRPVPPLKYESVQLCSCESGLALKYQALMKPLAVDKKPIVVQSMRNRALGVQRDIIHQPSPKMKQNLLTQITNLINKVENKPLFKKLEEMEATPQALIILGNRRYMNESPSYMLWRIKSHFFWRTQDLLLIPKVLYESPCQIKTLPPSKLESTDIIASTLKIASKCVAASMFSPTVRSL